MSNVDELVTRLRQLDEQLEQTSAEEFVQTQSELCDFASRHYEQLVDIVYDHLDQRVRENGMWVVRFLHQPGHQTVLNDIRLADPDPRMRSLAEAILYGSLVDQSLREAAEHPGGIKRYIAERLEREERPTIDEE